MSGGFLDRNIGQEDLQRLIHDLSDHRSAKCKVNHKRRSATPYEPKPLANREFLFCAETIAAAAQAEVAIAKIDCIIGQSPLNAALTRALARFEGIATVYPNGMKPRYKVCCYLDLVDPCSLPTGLASSADTVAASALAKRLGDLVAEIVANDETPFYFTPEMFIDLYRKIEGTGPQRDSSGPRSCDYRRKTVPNVDSDVYLPPKPSRIPHFLQDIATFSNDAPYSPITKSAIVHYQLEAIKAFPNDLDQLGRMIAVAIWKSTRLIDHVMPPFSLVPAMATMRHTRKLEPYQADDGFSKEGEMLTIDEWVFHSARGSEAAAKVALRVDREANRVVNRWTTILAEHRMRATRTTERILSLIIGQPVFTLSYITKNAHCSASTAATIVQTLQDCGIVTLGIDRKRNRVYEAPDAIEIFEKLQQTLLPKSPMKRESFIKANSDQ